MSKDRERIENFFRGEKEAALAEVKITTDRLETVIHYALEHAGSNEVPESVSSIVIDLLMDKWDASDRLVNVMEKQRAVERFLELSPEDLTSIPSETTRQEP